MGEQMIHCLAFAPVLRHIDSEKLNPDGLMPMQIPPPLTLVELFGAPGAGKTTLATAATVRTQVMTRHQLSELWRRQSLASRIGHVVRAFADLARLSAATRLATGCRLDRSNLARLARLIAKANWLGSRSSVVLLDQGFLQDLWSILYNSDREEPRAELLSPFIRSMYRGIDTRIVYIDVEPQTSASRIGGRLGGHSRLDGLPEAELHASLASAARLPARIVEAAKSAGLQIVTFDGTAAAEALVERLIPYLQEAEVERTRLRQASA
jgi:hypothetical protein